MLTTLERKLSDERRQRSTFEQQLAVEKRKKQDELATVRSTPVVRYVCVTYGLQMLLNIYSQFYTH